MIFLSENSHCKKIINNQHYFSFWNYMLQQTKKCDLNSPFPRYDDNFKKIEEEDGR